MIARLTERCPPPHRYMMYGHRVVRVCVSGKTGCLRCMRSKRGQKVAKEGLCHIPGGNRPPVGGGPRHLLIKLMLVCKKERLTKE